MLKPCVAMFCWSERVRRLESTNAYEMDEMGYGGQVEYSREVTAQDHGA